MTTKINIVISQYKNVKKQNKNGKIVDMGLSSWAIYLAYFMYLVFAFTVYIEKINATPIFSFWAVKQQTSSCDDP